MQNEFPIANQVDDEELQAYLLANPNHTQTITPHTFTQQNITASHNTKKVFNFRNHIHIQISEEIKKLADDEKYIKLGDLKKLNFDFKEICRVYKTLELKKIINVDMEIEDEIIKEKPVEIWTKLELFKLLEAIENYGDNWEKVSLCVGRSKADCILKFLKTDFGLDKLITENLVMARVIFIASRVHPRIAAVYAKQVLKNKEPNWEVIKYEAKRQVEFEKRKVERLNEILLEAELLKLNEKTEDFKSITNSICAERVEIRETILEIKKRIHEVVEELKNKEEKSGGK